MDGLWWTGGPESDRSLGFTFAVMFFVFVSLLFLYEAFAKSLLLGRLQNLRKVPGTHDLVMADKDRGIFSGIRHIFEDFVDLFVTMLAVMARIRGTQDTRLRNCIRGGF